MVVGYRLKMTGDRGERRVGYRLKVTGDREAKGSSCKNLDYMCHVREGRSSH